MLLLHIGTSTCHLIVPCRQSRKIIVMLTLKMPDCKCNKWLLKQEGTEAWVGRDFYIQLYKEPFVCKAVCLESLLFWKQLGKSFIYLYFSENVLFWVTYAWRSLFWEFFLLFSKLCLESLLFRELCFWEVFHFKSRLFGKSFI